MNQPGNSGGQSPTYSLRYLDDSRIEEMLQVYSLLQDAMGIESVEDLGSFRRMVSPRADPFVLPRVVCAFRGDEIIGTVVAATLKRLDAGFIAYSAVKEDSRRHGIYATMRQELLRRLAEEDGVQYVASELDQQDWLFLKYVSQWNATVLCERYEQPEAQGLQAKSLSLVASPTDNAATLGAVGTAALIREIYQRIYGIADVDTNESFIWVIASLSTDESSGLTN